MYINPFWVGVAATIGAEIAVIILAGIVGSVRRNKNKHG